MVKIAAISIDDERINLLVLEEMAKTAGIELLSFEDPLKAVEYIDRNPVDIVFVDYLMPGLDGIELTRHVKSMHPEVPVVMITSLGERRDIKLKALEAGANEFLTKPIDAAEFLTRTKNLLTLRNIQLQLKDRALLLEEEVKKATSTIVEREYETLIVLGRAAEYKDPETANHIARVAATAKILASALDLPPSQQELIAHAAPLHDVGKMGIPDSLLLKPGSLTESEFATIKKHTEIGFRILKNSHSPALRAGSQIALNHHERYSGGGYPRGISGNQIPMLSRIVSVADCWDAMISKRPYKDAWPVEKVVGIMTEEKGKQFDPVIVDCLFSNLPEIQRMYESLKDW